uniref:Photosynthesis system II assembly factor Ycf48/Hcf136-like domain-containing protein n=1 Tax=viral metagenome TaxID=1070528 RepID=A0A6M3LIG0_9ZZZZ
MTVRLFANTKRYIGLSSDTKPTSCLVGAFFWEYDTGNLFVTPDGGTTWAEYTQPNL